MNLAYYTTGRAYIERQATIDGRMEEPIFVDAAIAIDYHLIAVKQKT